MMRLLIVTLCVAVSTSAHAVSEVYGLSRSIRALGMGCAFYGLSDDEYALFYNPAGLSLYRTGSQGMLSLNFHVAPSVLSAISDVKDAATGSDSNASTIADKLTKYQGTPLYAGVTPFFPYFVTKNFGIGLLVGDTKIDFALLGKDVDTSVDLTAIADSGLFVGYARDFLEETLHVGMNVKFVARGGGKKTFSLVDIVADEDFDIDPETLGGFGAAFDFDIGSTYELPDIPYVILHRASLVFNNVLGAEMSIAKKGANPPGLSRTMTLGYHAVFPGFSVFDNFHALIDFAEFRLGGEDDPEYGAPAGSFWKHVNWGVEAPMAGWFIPRVGFHQGYLTAGFGLNLRILRLDFATYASELGNAPGRLGSRRIALRLQLGWGAAPPAPIVHSARNKPVDGAPPAEKKPEEKVEPAATPAPAPAGPGAKPEEPRTPQGGPVEMGPGPVINQTDEAPTFPQDGAEVPKVEGNAKDRFGVDQAAEAP